ncbi:MAG: AAA family ATPase, partial [bacterium]
MYLSSDAILKAIDELGREVHPFVGITFVACKHYNLSVGIMADVSIDTLTRTHMEAHHRIDRRSSYYFQPFRSPSSWVTEKYPSSGLQTVNTQTFSDVFMLTRAKRKWGFQSNYLDQMHNILSKQNVPTSIPADALAVWLFKDTDIGSIDNYDDLTLHFFDRFNISNAERDTIFSGRVMEQYLPSPKAFVPDPLEMTAVTHFLPDPPDAEAEGGRTSASLRLTNAGPAQEMSIDFGQRLTIVTGDNGLGKSFLLDFAWWVATGTWAEREALPQPNSSKQISQVEYTLSGKTGRLSTFTAKFDQKNY